MTATTTISYEAGQYEAALSRAHLDVVRTGAGHGPNAIMNVSLDGADASDYQGIFASVLALIAVTLAVDVISATLRRTLR
jgi:hypothetical protein